MAVPETGDLGQMGDADDLRSGGQAPQLGAHRQAGLATDAGVVATYAIAIGLGIVGMTIIFDPDQFWGSRAFERLRRRR